MTLRQQLKELQLIRCSLMPDETFSFVLDPQHAAIWTSLLDALDHHASGFGELADPAEPACPAKICVKRPNARIWFEILLPSDAETLQCTNVSVRGENISREEQEHWRSVVRDKVLEVKDMDFPVYELVSLHLLPMIHAHVSTANHFAHPRPKDHTTISQGRRPSRKFHALLTSHHLVSPTKRRMMQQWSCKLNLTGFAKVGYPGIIYSEGDEEDIKEFIENIKAMQWLALRVRFVEPLESSQDPHPTVGAPSPWVELQKIAEVLSYMRKRGRETTLTNLGIGNSANSR